MAFQGDSIYWVEVEKIVPNPFQPRREFDEAKLKELSESIRMYGILQPLTVTRNEIQRDDGAFYTEYELIAGERRLRASKLAGLKQVPVIIRSGEDTEQEKLELAIIENLQREDLNAVDRALAFKQLAEVFKLSHSQVAKKVGRSREYVSNSIRLLALPECMLNSLRLGDMSEGHARTLLMLKERPEEQDVVYREILLKKLSVREVERIARKIATDKVRKKRWNDTDAHLIAIEKEFTDTLGTRVQIAKTDFGGKLTIDYFSDDDLQTLLEIMQSQGKITDVQSRTSSAYETNDDDSQTVIHEMSPEASIMAKIATATPLEEVDPVPEAIPVVPQTESVDEARVQEQRVPDTPVEVSSVPEAVNPVSEASEPATFAHPPVAETPPEYVLSNSRVHSAQEYLQDTATEPEQVSDSDAEPSIPSVENTSVEQLESQEYSQASVPEVEKEKEDEFSFITQTSDKLPENDDGDVSIPVSEVEHSRQEEVKEELQNAVEPEKQITEDDGDLYSMKNFSL